MEHRTLRTAGQRTCATRVSFAVVLMLAAASLVYAQGGGSSSVTGTVVDTSGAVIPGADVTARNDANGAESATVSNGKGLFTIPALNPGTYTITVSLMGFKKFVLPDVKLDASTPATLRAALEVGGLEETVVVQGGSDVVQTQSSAIATTIDAKQIQNLPLVSRNALTFVTNLAGVSTPGGAWRNATVNGLPQSAINISIDGINSQDNFNKTGDGFFSTINPRIDAVEEITVSSATPEAQSAGQGAVQINFVTRAGTNQFHGSLYHYLRNPDLNSNYWFNNRDLPPGPDGKAPRDQIKLNQYGFRIGGPVVIPGLFNGHDKLFYFVNYEELRQPSQITRQRTVLTPLAQQGIFTYAGRQVDLLALAAANNQPGAMDPTVARLLGDIRQATAQTGGLQALSDPNLQRFTFTNSAQVHNYYPTLRLDENVSQRHRLSFTWNRQSYDANPDTLNSRDPTFPGFPNHGSQTSTRYAFATWLRSTLTSNLVNEARFGGSGATVTFGGELGLTQFKGTPVADQNGFAISLGACCNAATLTSPTASSAPSARNAPDKVFEDTINWSRGAHQITVGGSFTRVSFWASNQTVVPSIGFGIDTTDPAAALFTPANFQGASTTNLNDARGLYALLTGHVNAINGTARLDENTGQYVYSGQGFQRGHMSEIGVYGQDSWRIRRDLTMNIGLRYELQLPFVSDNSSYTFATVEDVWGVSGVGNLFKPGVMTGRKPTFQQYTKGAKAFNVDTNNFAPNLGFAWRPSKDTGPLRTLLGHDGDTVVRAAYALAYNRNGMGDYSGVFGSNPGVSINANRSVNLGNLGTLPLLLRDTARLGAPDFQKSPVYPMTDVITEDANAFDPNIKTPYAQSWTFGVQRAINRTTAVEVRYVGTRHLFGWGTFNYNEINIKENGFLDEFRKAQANLQANIAAGRGNSFAYFGPGTGTSPLPTYLAFFNGQPSAQSGNAALYSGTSWTNTTFVNRLALMSPSPTNAANDLFTDAGRRANAAAAGVAANFFIANPDLQGGANLTGNTGYTRYDSMQLDVRRRLSAGLLINGSYVFSRQLESSRFSLRVGRERVTDTGDPGQTRHAMKVNWVYDMPFGSGRRFGRNASGVLDRLIGGWQFDGSGRVQSGRELSFGNVRLVGMTDDQLRDVFKIRKDDANRIVYILPQDIIDNTIRAFSVSATSSTGYGTLGPPSGRYFAPANGPDCIQIVSGDCAPRNHFVTGPAFVRFDLGVEKRIAIVRTVNFVLRGEFLNAFNNINFVPVASTGSSATLDQVTSAFRDTNNSQDPGGRLVQIVSRITW
jgi:carboxypeptidase family protein/TonB-dependent receptor-like protein